MTPDEMRNQSKPKADTDRGIAFADYPTDRSDFLMHGLWLIAAEICERLDKISRGCDCLTCNSGTRKCDAYVKASVSQSGEESVSKTE